MFFAAVLSISLEFHIIDIVYFNSSYYATLINFIIIVIYIYIYIYIYIFKLATVYIIYFMYVHYN